MKKSLKRFITLALSVLLIAAAMPMYAIAAKTVTPLTGQVSVTDSKNTAEFSNDTVTITAKGSLFGKATNNITVKNESSANATISFNYTVTSASSFTIAGASAATSGTYSVVLDAGATLAIVLTSNSGLSNTTATLTLKNFSYAVAASASNVTVEYDNTLGSTTVDGTAVNSGDVFEMTLSDGATLAATAKTGVTFLGWINAESGAILSESASFVLKPAADMTVKPVFIKSGSAPHFKVGNAYLFDDLNKAAQTAASNAINKITLMNSATLPVGTYTIPSGVTLLIPFDAAGTLYTSEPASVEYTAYKTPSAFRTLTMASGANIIVNGTISLPAKHIYAQGSRIGCVVTGAYGHIKMEDGSNITVNNGGYLYAWGYITGNGTVIANSGANIFEYFQFTDFRGGSQTSDMENGVFPLSQYYVQNIEVPMTLYSGAKEKSYTSLHMSSMTFSEDITFIGSSDAMFTCTSGSITKWYDGSTDRLIIEANGDFSVSPIKITIGLGSLLGTTIKTEEYELPINSNVTVISNSGTVNINQDVAFYPGSYIVVSENSICNIGAGVSAYVYDADEWGTFCFGPTVNGQSNFKFRPLPYAPSRTYNRTDADLVDAAIQVDGVVDASKGYVYTTTGGANIFSTKAGKVITNAGTQTVTHQLVQGTGYTEIALTPAKVKNANGTYTQTYTDTYNYVNGSWDGACEHVNCTSVVTAPTCTAGGYTTYTCTVCGCIFKGDYTDATGHAYDDGAVTTAPGCETVGIITYTCSTCGNTYTEEIPAIGHSYSSETTTKPTCTEKGVLTYTCTCGDTYTEEIPAIGHSYSSETTTKPTCTEKGVLTYTCANCGDTYTEEIAANGHSYDTGVVTTKPTCDKEGVTTHTCSVCGDSYTTSIDAIGHNYEATGVTAPTCTENGYTTYTCSHCGDSYKDDEVAANGHNHVAEVTAPTCTEKGYTTYTCSACGDKYVDNEVAALGHTPGADATCTTAQTCTVCGTELVAAHHDYADEFTVDVEATHTKEGSKSKHCAHCDSVTEVTVIPMIICDINGDDVVDKTETIKLRRYILGIVELTDEEKFLFDMNDNGIVDVLDLIGLNDYIAAQ